MLTHTICMNMHVFTQRIKKDAARIVKDSVGSNITITEIEEQIN